MENSVNFPQTNDGKSSEQMHIPCSPISIARLALKFAPFWRERRVCHVCGGVLGNLRHFRLSRAMLFAGFLPRESPRSERAVFPSRGVYYTFLAPIGGELLTGLRDHVNWVVNHG